VIADPIDRATCLAVLKKTCIPAVEYFLVWTLGTRQFVPERPIDVPLFQALDETLKVIQKELPRQLCSSM